MREEGCLESELPWSLCGRKVVWSLCGGKAVWSMYRKKTV